MVAITRTRLRFMPDFWNWGYEVATGVNPSLAWLLAWRNLRHHATVSVATILGITLGTAVIAAILIVDSNSSSTPGFGDQLSTLPETVKQDTGCRSSGSGPCPRVMRVYFERNPGLNQRPGIWLPSQEADVSAGIDQAEPPVRRGEEDYQAMRLAVRTASLIAFSVGGIIVFYTMRFSVASRIRELALVRCLGEDRRNVALSLLVEALMMGIIGTILGLLLAFPAAMGLLSARISTTGRVPDAIFSIPWLELTIISMLAITIALLGVAGPVRMFYRMKLADVMQPRFMSRDNAQLELPMQGLGWLVPPVMIASWLSIRPFVQSWLSVVQFFLAESVLVVMLAVAILWWIRPLLRGTIAMVESVLRPALPLEAALAGKRMRLTSHTLALTVAGVTLVFSLFTALHDISRTLKDEIHDWASEALYPFVYFERDTRADIDEANLQRDLKRNGIRLFRLSGKTRGELPVRLIAADDINPVRVATGKRPLAPGTVILSHTLASRYGVLTGDRMVIETDSEHLRFEVIDVTDEAGFYAEDGQYVDLKSYALFSDGNPLFQGSLQQTLGQYAMASKADGTHLTDEDIRLLHPWYRLTRRGANLGQWQVDEIDRDFLIFDFVLFMTVVLAIIGVANNILIQVHAREREFAVLRALGISKAQVIRLLLVEGAIIGIVSAILAMVLGNIIGALSVSFLDRFTLFEYTFRLSPLASLVISMFTVFSCTVAAIYPAVVANRVSSAESLHYE